MAQDWLHLWQPTKRLLKHSLELIYCTQLLNRNALQNEEQALPKSNKHAQPPLSKVGDVILTCPLRLT